MPRKLPFTRPARGAYMITVPMVFDRQSVKSKDWPETKRALLASVTALLAEKLEHTERIIATKH